MAYAVANGIIAATEGAEALTVYKGKLTSVGIKTH
jgi:hypothetical protein